MRKKQDTCFGATSRNRYNLLIMNYLTVADWLRRLRFPQPRLYGGCVWLRLVASGCGKRNQLNN